MAVSGGPRKVCGDGPRARAQKLPFGLLLPRDLSTGQLEILDREAPILIGVKKVKQRFDLYPRRIFEGQLVDGEGPRCIVPVCA